MQLDREKSEDAGIRVLSDFFIFKKRLCCIYPVRTFYFLSKSIHEDSVLFSSSLMTNATLFLGRNTEEVKLHTQDVIFFLLLSLGGLVEQKWTITLDLDLFDSLFDDVFLGYQVTIYHEISPVN